MAVRTGGGMAVSPFCRSQVVSAAAVKVGLSAFIRRATFIGHRRARLGSIDGGAPMAAGRRPRVV